MQSENETATSGTWREGQFVRWQDVFLPVQALLTWFGLLVLSVVWVAAGTQQSQVNKFAHSLTTDPTVIQIVAASFEIVLLFYAWRVARRVADESFVARYRPIGWSAFLLALAGGMTLALLLFWANSQLQSHAIVEFHVTRADRALTPKTAADLPLGLLCLALIAPLAEEMYFRGVLLSWLRRKMFAPLAILASAAIFALVHLRFVSHPSADGWVYTAAIAVVGVVTATLATTTRSLWGPYAVHAGYNATLLCIPVFYPLLFG